MYYKYKCINRVRFNRYPYPNLLILNNIKCLLCQTLTKGMTTSRRFFSSVRDAFNVTTLDADVIALRAKFIRSWELYTTASFSPVLFTLHFGQNNVD